MYACVHWVRCGQKRERDRERERETGLEVVTVHPCLTG